MAKLQRPPKNSVSLPVYKKIWRRTRLVSRCDDGDGDDRDLHCDWKSRRVAVITEKMQFFKLLNLYWLSTKINFEPYMMVVMVVGVARPHVAVFMTVAVTVNGSSSAEVEQCV